MQTEPTNLRMPAKLKAKAKKIAEERNIKTLSQAIIIATAEWVEREERKMRR